MMKNILVVVGAGNKNGNTNLLCDSFIQGAKDANHHVTKINLDGRIMGCRGCGACQINGGSCVIQDDMQEYYPMFAKADIIVLVSPLYFWSISGRLKSWIDRLYAISINDEYPYRDSMLLRTAGSDHFYAFEQAVSFYRFFTRALGWKDRGMVLAGGCRSEKEKYVPQSYIQEAYQLGKNL